MTIFRLNLLRAAYLILVVGLGLTIWPEILDTSQMPSLQRGVVISMLGAMSLVALLGLRYPLKLLPLLLFEMAWKTIWLLRIGLTLWLTHSFDDASMSTAFSIALVAIFPFLVPWDYVVRTYVTGKGDPWWTRNAAATVMAQDSGPSR